MQQSSMRANWNRFLSLLANYKWFVFIVVLLSLLVETTAIAERYLFKLIIDDATLFSAGTITQTAFLAALAGIALGYGALILIRLLTRWFRYSFANRLDSELILELKQRFFNHILHLSHRFHTTHKTGTLISRLTRGSRAVENMVDVIVFNFLPVIFQFIVIVIMLVGLSWHAVVIISSTMLLFIAWSAFVQSKQIHARREANDVEDREKGSIGDIFTNIESVKYFGKEARIKSTYKAMSERTAQALVRMWNYYRLLEAGQILIIALGTLGLFYFTTQALMLGSITLGTFVFIYTVYTMLISSLYGFVGGLRQFTTALTDFESLFQYEDEHNEIEDKPHAKALAIKKGTIRFDNVSFTYNAKKIFENLNLDVHANEKVAIIGPSGAGKSTLIKLLYRLYDTTEGSVSIDGSNVRDVQQESLRSEIAIVPQEPVLFDDSIYNNILFSNPTATREQVLAAIRFAQLDKAIADFPEKENTIVGERGIKLSGGEKQRVSIARALLANKKILVLDEATSSLDSQTEHEIQQGLAKLLKGRTAIIIAHRLSTIMTADRIIVLEKGKIVQTGTHAQLIKQQGLYKKLWNLQKGGYIK